MLFRACNIEKAGVVCKEAVPGIFEDATCILHIQLPPQRNYAKKKYESDSDDESTPTNSLPHVKKEDLSDADSTRTQSTHTSFDKDTGVIESKPDKKPDSPSINDKNVTICHDDANEQTPPSDPVKSEPIDKEA